MNTLFPKFLLPLLLPLTLHAAPMDAFLSAQPADKAGRAEIELGYDLMNGAVDVFNVRGNDADYAGTNVGDYHGEHVRGAYALTRRWQVDGGLWKRRIDYRSDQARINSWQAATQYTFLEGQGYVPSLALRVGAWGNYADALHKSSATSVRGLTLDSINVKDPRDNQVQMDLIGTWAMPSGWSLSAFGSAGSSKVSVGAVSGTAHLGACLFDVDFGDQQTVATLAAPCTTSSGTQILEQKVVINNQSLGVNVNDEIRYSARYANSGFMLQWRDAAWLLRGGYQYQYLKRDKIDALIQSRGQTAYQSNHILIGELRRQMLRHVSLFARGQYMRHQFVGEIPFAYNTLTASRFAKHYGFVSAGLVMNF